MWLRTLEFSPPKPAKTAFPWSLPLLQHSFALQLRAPVTFFAGENGTGKSTLLEALAAATQVPTIGSDESEIDPNLKNARELGAVLRLGWTRKTRNGFFLRAEDVFGFQKRINQLRAELSNQISALESERSARYDAGLERAIGSIKGQIGEIETRYGADADARSHGEAFLSICQNRLTAPGIHLLDEPETPLSPLRQMALMTLIKNAVENGSQFLIASHSPLLLAFPGAQIWSFDCETPCETSWDEIESVRLWRAFWARPQAFVARLE